MTHFCRNSIKKDSFLIPSSDSVSTFSDTSTPVWIERIDSLEERRQTNLKEHDFKKREYCYRRVLLSQRCFLIMLVYSQCQIFTNGSKIKRSFSSRQVRSCTWQDSILSTIQLKESKRNQSISKVHDRMPLIDDKNGIGSWIADIDLHQYRYAYLVSKLVSYVQKEAAYNSMYTAFFY